MSDRAVSSSEAQEAFFRAMWEWIRSHNDLPYLTDDNDPVKVLERLKTARPADATNGLREGVRDLIEMTKNLSEQELESVDIYLRNRGAPTLTSLRLQQKRFLRQLIRQGRINRTEEYRFLASLLSDVGDAGIDEK